MNLQPAKGRFYKLVSKEGKHLFCRDVFPPLASTFLFLTKVMQPATLPLEKGKATEWAPPIHRKLNYRSYLQFWEKNLAAVSPLPAYVSPAQPFVSPAWTSDRGRGTVVPRAWNARVAGAERSCRGRDTTAEYYSETAESPARTASGLMQFSKAVLGDTNAPSG